MIKNRGFVGLTEMLGRDEMGLNVAIWGSEKAEIGFCVLVDVRNGDLSDVFALSDRPL